MIAGGFDDYTVMAVSGHSCTRMLARYTHPTEERKADALGSFRLSDTGSKPDPVKQPATDGHNLVTNADDSDRELEELKELLRKSGGRQEARTPDLRVANAALSQLS